MKNISSRYTLILIIILSAIAQAQELPTLVIEREATYLEGLNARATLVDQCRPHKRMPASLFYYTKKLKKQYADFSQKLPRSGDYHVLSIEIVDLFGLGGGTFSGGKKLVVRGTLKDNHGKLLGSFFASRVSLGNVMLLGMQGTCTILAKVNKKLGKDITKWLREPSVGALLGDSKSAKELKDKIAAGVWPPPADSN